MTNETTTNETTIVRYTRDMREFPSRFRSMCACGCGQRIAIGETVLWTPATGAYRKACVVMPTAAELAAAEAERQAAAEARARIEAERQAAWEADHAEERKAARKAQREARKARIATLLTSERVRYGGSFDDLNSETCDRCGGGGRMPFSVYAGLCFKCDGKGRVWRAQVPQPKDATVELDAAQVGDIVADSGGTKYRVTGITWRRTKEEAMMEVRNNQRVHCIRLVDGDTHVALLRHADAPYLGQEHVHVYIIPSEAMIGQPVERDETGAWRVY